MTVTRKRFLRTALGLTAVGAWQRAYLKAGAVSDEAAAVPLKNVAGPCRFRVGAQVEKGALQSTEFAQVIASNFNLITPGNELKWTRLRPSPDKFNFADSDWMIQFAMRNQLLVHGHNLCWNSPANPAWFKDVITKDNAREYLTTHITTVVKRYAGQIDSWDVVNEPIVGWSKRDDMLYPGMWLNFLGREYIDTAFRAAASADPKALLVLNCYWLEEDSEGDEKCRRATLDLLKQLIGKRVPVHAIGIESHLTAGKPLGGSKLRRFLGDVRNLGLEVLITELDVNDVQVSGDVSTVDNAVAQTYVEYLKLVGAALPLNSVIFWTPSDKYSWMNSAQFRRPDSQPHRAGLFDRSLKTKPAFAGVASALAQTCRS